MTNKESLKKKKKHIFKENVPWKSIILESRERQDLPTVPCGLCGWSLRILKGSVSKAGTWA